MNREDLKNFKYAQDWIKGRVEYIEGYKSTINKLTSILSDMPKGSRQIQDNEAEKLAQLMDNVNELVNKIAEIDNKQKSILKQLDEVEQPYRNILDKIYIQNKSLTFASAEMGYDYKYFCKLHGTALDKFDNINNLILTRVKR